MPSGVGGLDPAGFRPCSPIPTVLCKSRKGRTYPRGKAYEGQWTIDFFEAQSIILLHAQIATHRVSLFPVVVYGSPYGKHLQWWRPPPSRCVCLLCHLHGIDGLTIGYLSIDLSWLSNIQVSPVPSIGTLSFTISSSAPELLIIFS